VPVDCQALKTIQATFPAASPLLLDDHIRELHSVLSIITTLLDMRQAEIYIRLLENSHLDLCHGGHCAVWRDRF
jgi:hypothetical protein